MLALKQNVLNAHSFAYKFSFCSFLCLALANLRHSCWFPITFLLSVLYGLDEDLNFFLVWKKLFNLGLPRTKCTRQFRRWFYSAEWECLNGREGGLGFYRGKEVIHKSKGIMKGDRQSYGNYWGEAEVVLSWNMQVQSVSLWLVISLENERVGVFF